MDTALQTVESNVRLSGWDHEVSFWRDFVQSDRFANNWCSAVPNPELEREIHVLMRSVAQRVWADEGRPARILDIGSGPVSILTHSFVGVHVDLQAADPLGKEYDKLWDSPRKAAVVKPIAVDGEQLLSKFGTNHFDITYIRNALDHTANPITTLQQMLAITKPGGYVIAQCSENEADAEGWHGFHQWNIHTENGDYIVTGRDLVQAGVFDNIPGMMKVCVDNSTPPHGRVQCLMIGRKKKPVGLFRHIRNFFNR